MISICVVIHRSLRPGVRASVAETILLFCSLRFDLKTIVNSTHNRVLALLDIS